MNIFMVMKKLIFSYLNSTYPDIYVLRSHSHGIEVNFIKTSDSDKDKSTWFSTRREMIETIKLLFSVDGNTANNIIDEWVESRPHYEYVKNSTGESVLISVSNECVSSTVLSGAVFYDPYTLL